MATVVLTVIGDDQAGLVDALAQVIADHGGSWQESHMAHMAGKFAGIVVATVPDGRTDELVASLGPLEEKGLLDITVEVTTQPSAEPSTHFTVELLGQDRTGIIRDLSSVLAAARINIVELHTETRSAPMAGGMLFEAMAELAVPAGMTEDDIATSLQTLDAEFDITITKAA